MPLNRTHVPLKNVKYAPLPATKEWLNHAY
nr:MAG TPA: hypothetical protein [Caudoviricetes sp.]